MVDDKPLMLGAFRTSTCPNGCPGTVFVTLCAYRMLTCGRGTSGLWDTAGQEGKTADAGALRLLRLRSHARLPASVVCDRL